MEGAIRLAEILEPMGVAQPVHASPGERLTGTGREALRVERGRDLRMGALLLEELGDPVQGLRRCGAYLPDLPGQGLPQRGRRSAAKADVDRDLTVLAQRDVLKQEGGHALALAGWGARIMPQCEGLRKAIGREPQKVLTVDVERQEVRLGDRIITATMPDGPRNQLVSGTWDSTAVLLEAGAAIEATAQKLPYVTGY